MSLFKSFFLGGFECACQGLADGSQLDLLASTGHARHAESDYRALQAHGIHAARDGLRWHLVEARAGQYDWRSFLPMLRAARRTGVQVIWDLCHYGYPAHVDIWAADFPERFARYAAAAAALVRDESDATPFYCPVNEISFWAWAGGDVRYFAPLAQDRGMELKRQLVRASLAAMDAVWAVDRRARFVLADPAIHVLAQDPADAQAAASYCAAQYQAWDMIAGRLEPGLGGAPGAGLSRAWRRWSSAPARAPSRCSTA